MYYPDGDTVSNPHDSVILTKGTSHMRFVDFYDYVALTRDTRVKQGLND